VPGVFDAAAVQQAIRTDRPGFQRAAHRLHAAGVEALAAIDRRDVEALVRAGGRIDQACESCHSVYWYPNAGPPAHR
jgi:cytochrome c556